MVARTYDAPPGDEEALDTARGSAGEDEERSSCQDSVSPLKTSTAAHTMARPPSLLFRDTASLASLCSVYDPHRASSASYSQRNSGESAKSAPTAECCDSSPTAPATLQTEPPADGCGISQCGAPGLLVSAGSSFSQPLASKRMPARGAGDSFCASQSLSCYARGRYSLGRSASTKSSADVTREGEKSRRRLRPRSSCHLSQSGTFTLHGLRVDLQGFASRLSRRSRRSGADGSVVAGEMTTGGEPMRRSVAAVDMLAIASISELEFLDVLGQGCSAVVHRARHAPSGKLVAVKTISVLEKSRRRQVGREHRALRKAVDAGARVDRTRDTPAAPACVQVACELRAMAHSHSCAHLVTMHNAFYEDASVHIVLELMGGGSLERVISAHPNGLTDEAVARGIAWQVRSCADERGGQ